MGATATISAGPNLNSPDELTQALIDQLPFAIALFKGPSFIVENCNLAYKKILGQTDVEGKRFEDAFPGFRNRSFKFILRSVFQTGKAFVAHDFKTTFHDVATGQEEERFWDLSYTRICDRAGVPYGIYFFGSDVTERVRQTNELRAAKLESERASAIKSTFLANMSHEIRTPLGVIIGYTDLLRDSEMDRSEQVRLIDVVNRNAKSLTRVIDDILDLSKVEAGRLPINFAPMHLGGTVAEVILMFQERAKILGLELSLDIQPDLPLRLLFDASRLRQILINLVGNALKFTQRGSVKLSVKGDQSSAESWDYEIQVKDTGRGLSEVQKKSLFQPFTQADNTTSRDFGGSGLGLVLSRKLAEAMGGNVFIGDCAINQGCTFHVVFNATLSTQSMGFHGFESARQPNSQHQSLKGLRILLVEDSEDNQYLVSRLLTTNGASVVTANNGAIGLERALSTDFDAILMDIQMPVMDGYTALEKLAAAGYTKPVIALTAHALKEERDKTSHAGFKAHLTKPIDVNRLIAIIRSATGFRDDVSC